MNNAHNSVMSLFVHIVAAKGVQLLNKWTTYSGTIPQTLQLTGTECPLLFLLLLLGSRHIQPSTYTNVTAPPVRLLGGEGTIPKSTQYVTVVTDTTQ